MKNSKTRSTKQTMTPIYTPSLIDRLMDKIEALPGSTWAFYLSALVFFTIINYLAYWWDGTVVPGTFNFTLSTMGIYQVFPIALLHYLDVVAKRSLNTFRPVLDVGETDYARLQYELTTLPAIWGWVALILGIPMAFSEVNSNPKDFLITPTTSDALIVFLIIMSAIFAVTFLSLLIHSIRQLRLVSIIHRQASKINLFSLIPVHAFSNLSARTGIGLVFLIVFLMLEPETGAVGIGIFLVLIPMAFAAFVLPLIGMYFRIRDEKEHRVDKINAHIETMIAKIQDQVQGDKFNQADSMNKTLNSLIAGRDLLEKIPAWPWEPGTLRGFATTVILPILLWLVTRLLERFV